MVSVLAYTEIQDVPSCKAVNIDMPITPILVCPLKP